MSKSFNQQGKQKEARFMASGWADIYVIQPDGYSYFEDSLPTEEAKRMIREAIV